MHRDEVDVGVLAQRAHGVVVAWRDDVDERAALGLGEHGRDHRLPEPPTDDADAHRPVTTHGRNVARFTVTPPAYRPTMGYRGKVEEQERARELRARNMTLQDIATELGVSPSRRCRSGSATCRSPRRSAEPARNAVRIPFHEAKLAQIAALERRGHRAHRHAERRRVPRRRGRAVRGRGRQDRREREVRQHRSDDGAVLLRVAATVLRRSTRRGCGSGSTSTRASTSTPPRRTGPTVTGIPLDQFRQPYRAVADPEHPAEQARVRVRLRLLHAARRRTVGSWDWCGRCYRRAPFRGSSIGRAFGC